MGRLSLLAVLTAAALFISAPGVGLAVDDDGAVDDGLTNEIDESDLGEGDELVEWGEDVEVWGERPDGSKFVPEVLPVVDYYAKAMSVSVEETKRRFAIEDAAGAFKRELAEELGDSFVGVWIEHEPEFRIFVAAVPADVARVTVLLKTTRFAGVAEVVEVERSRAALVDLAVKVQDVSPVPVETGIFVSERAYRVKVFVAGDADRRLLDDALAAAGLTPDSGLIVETVEQLSQPLSHVRDSRHFHDTRSDVHGGLALRETEVTSPTGLPMQCTTGFSVRQGGWEAGGSHGGPLPEPDDDQRQSCAVPSGKEQAEVGCAVAHGSRPSHHQRSLCGTRYGVPEEPISPQDHWHIGWIGYGRGHHRVQVGQKLRLHLRQDNRGTSVQPKGHRQPC